MEAFGTVKRLLWILSLFWLLYCRDRKSNSVYETVGGMNAISQPPTKVYGVVNRHHGSDRQKWV